MSSFSLIPEVVIDHVRSVFERANDAVSRALSDHPSMHEESLDQALITSLTVQPAAFFEKERAAVAIEAHWLGGRRMFGRWEIADIALLMLLRREGHLLERKVALLQTKRLYSREISVGELEQSDYIIGIGRLGDRTGQLLPLTKPRAFSFSDDCVYGAMASGAPQIERIDQYERDKRIPVHYAFYNPVNLPFKAAYPSPTGLGTDLENSLGCRVGPANDVHRIVNSLPRGQAPSFGTLRSVSEAKTDDSFGSSGCRLEHFVADRVLRCLDGALFDGSSDEHLESLFYERSAPISAAIAITVDIGEGG
jgi:hypothetical protein